MGLSFDCDYCNRDSIWNEPNLDPGNQIELQSEDVNCNKANSQISQDGKDHQHKDLMKDETETTEINKKVYHELEQYLRENGLYDDLYDILSSQHVDLEMITNDLNVSELDQFCNAFGLDKNQKSKFYLLYSLIKDTQNSDTENESGSND